MTRLVKYLTNSNYRDVLYIIGRSEKPLSGVEIEKKAALSRYVYDMLKELAPSEFSTDIRLFGWEEILQKNNDGKYKRQLINKFNRTFGLNWEIDKKDCESANIRNNELIVIAKVDDNTVIIAHTKIEQIIVIELPKGRMMLDDVHMSVRSTKGEKLELRKNYSHITLKNERR
jgi:hypothetical protein